MEILAQKGNFSIDFKVKVKVRFELTTSILSLVYMLYAYLSPKLVLISNIFYQWQLNMLME